jgi:hypothetical protein
MAYVLGMYAENMYNWAKITCPISYIHMLSHMCAHTHTNSLSLSDIKKHTNKIYFNTVKYFYMTTVH